MKKHSLPYKKKLKKNEKIGLNNQSSTRSKGTSISDNESARQYLLQANEPMSDDNDENDGDNTVAENDVYYSRK